MATRVANAFLALFAYPLKNLWPVDLAAFYPHPGLVAPETFSATAPIVWAAAVSALLVTGLVLWKLKRRPELALGWSWYILTLMPVIGLVQVGGQWIADRYAYLTLVGLYVGIVFAVDATLLAHQVSGAVRRAALGAGLILALVPIPLTLRQIEVWRDTRSLFEHALSVTERNYVAHELLGNFEHRAGNVEAAEAHYRATLAVAPRLPAAHNNLGGLMMVDGKLEEARGHLLRALELDPRFTKSRLALAYIESLEGNSEAALAAYRDAVRFDPSSVEARLGLAQALEANGDPGGTTETLEVLRAAVALQPNHSLALVRLGEALARTGQAAEALGHLEAAAAQPSPPAEAGRALVWLLATSADESVRDPNRAYRLARALDDSWPSQPARAAAYAAVGEFDTASKVALEAAVSAPPGTQPKLVDELVDMVKQFKSKTPLRR